VWNVYLYSNGSLFIRSIINHCTKDSTGLTINITSKENFFLYASLQRVGTGDTTPLILYLGIMWRWVISFKTRPLYSSTFWGAGCVDIRADLYVVKNRQIAHPCCKSDYDSSDVVTIVRPLYRLICSESSFPIHHTYINFSRRTFLLFLNVSLA